MANGKKGTGEPDVSLHGMNNFIRMKSTNSAKIGEDEVTRAMVGNSYIIYEQGTRFVFYDAARTCSCISRRLAVSVCLAFKITHLNPCFMA